MTSEKATSLPKKRAARMWELDFFRGFAIIMVTWDHAMASCMSFRSVWKAMGAEGLVRLGTFATEYWNGDLRLFWRPAFLFIFFFTSGICTAFSKNNLTRGLRLGGVAAAVSWGTYVFSMLVDDDWFILFGVLHCIALVILVYWLISVLVKLCTKIAEKIAKKTFSARTKEIILAIACIALSIVGFALNKKFNISLYSSGFVETESKILGMFFFAENWATSDYFPMFPFVCFFLLGAGMARFLYPKKQSLFPTLDGKWNTPFTVSGRLSLVIYVFGQVAIFVVLTLLTFIATGEFLLAY